MIGAGQIAQASSAAIGERCAAMPAHVEKPRSDPSGCRTRRSGMPGIIMSKEDQTIPPLKATNRRGRIINYAKGC